MQLKRVVITGAGVVSPFGLGLDTLFTALCNGESAVRVQPALAGIAGVATRLAAQVPNLDVAAIPRKLRRSMSRASQLAWFAVQEALQTAQLGTVAGDDSVGLAIGSTSASVESLEEFFSTYLPGTSVEQITAMLFFRTMGHSVAANMAQAYGLTGRVLSPSAACSTGLQAVGLGFEAIGSGAQDIMLCGGVDDYHPLTSATFDIMAAASCAYNDQPDKAPRPFDNDRDGIVCAEGAGVLVLESLESAQRRNAPILTEILGFATTSDPSNMASPAVASIKACMERALRHSGLKAEELDYINAHATGTVQGDAAECEAIAELFGGATPPVSSLKGHLGHTMAASGAIELAACLKMLQHKRILPTRNLDNPCVPCQRVTLLQENASCNVKAFMKNSFALGGINCSLIIKEYHD